MTKPADLSHLPPDVIWACIPGTDQRVGYIGPRMPPPGYPSTSAIRLRLQRTEEHHPDGYDPWDSSDAVADVAYLLTQLKDTQP